MKKGDIVYRKTPFVVVATGEEKSGENVVAIHLTLQAVEQTQYINCTDKDVEVAATTA